MILWHDVGENFSAFVGRKSVVKCIWLVFAYLYCVRLLRCPRASIELFLSPCRFRFLVCRGPKNRVRALFEIFIKGCGHGAIYVVCDVVLYLCRCWRRRWAIGDCRVVGLALDFLPCWFFKRRWRVVGCCYAKPENFDEKIVIRSIEKRLIAERAHYFESARCDGRLPCCWAVFWRFWCLHMELRRIDISGCVANKVDRFPFFIRVIGHWIVRVIKFFEW